jgi:hypothetical protein
LFPSVSSERWWSRKATRGDKADTSVRNTHLKRRDTAAPAPRCTAACARSTVARTAGSPGSSGLAPVRLLVIDAVVVGRRRRHHHGRGRGLLLWRRRRRQVVGEHGQELVVVEAAGAWPSAAAAVMKMTPALRRLAGPAHRLCRAAIPRPGTCDSRAWPPAVSAAMNIGDFSRSFFILQTDLLLY